MAAATRKVGIKDFMVNIEAGGRGGGGFLKGEER